MLKESKPPTSPYMDAQNVWLERYGTYIQQAYNWRLLALLETVALCAAIFGLIYVASQSKFVPYVVAVDRIGLPIGVKIADRADKADDRIVRAQLANWIEDARSVTFDRGVEKQNINHVYAMVASESTARSYLNAWYGGGHSPYDLAKTKTVSVQIAWVLPISSQSWQAQWAETIRNDRGDVTSTEQWVGTIGVAIHPPQDDATILQNPLGLYITSLNWARKL
jgi:type IV secretion system protein TrbF